MPPLTPPTEDLLTRLRATRGFFAAAERARLIEQLAVRREPGVVAALADYLLSLSPRVAAAATAAAGRLLALVPPHAVPVDPERARRQRAHAGASSKATLANVTVP